VPTTAHDRIGTGPLAALLILLSLLLGSGGPVAGASELRAPGSRLGAGRQAATALVLPSAIRTSAEDAASESGDESSTPPGAPALVGEPRWSRPPFPSSGPAALPRAANESYRARAPPAS
jgi:hypothetical protein